MFRTFTGRGGVLILFVVAWAILLFRLQQVPPGFQHDQSFSVRDALEVLSGHYPIYFPDNFGRGPLFMYSAAGIIALAGGHLVWSLRFTAVIWGMLGLAASYALARRCLSAGAALLAVALTMGSFWFLLAARLGVESIALLSLAIATFYFVHRGLARHVWADFAIAGLLGGVANYSYLASRTLYALPPALILYFAVRALWVRRGNGSRTVAAGRHAALADVARASMTLGVMLAVSAPLLLYLRTHAGTDGRIGALSQALGATLAGNPGPLLANAGDTVRSILWSGSASLPFHYSLPGRPVLQPVWALALLVGLGITIRRLNRPEEFLLLLALGLGLGPDLLTGADALYMRAIYALPLIFILAVRGFQAVVRLVGRRLPTGYRPYARGVLVALIAGLWLWHSADNVWAYFGTWAQAERTERIYNGDFRAAASLVDAQAQSAVFVGSDRDTVMDAETYRYYEPQRQDVRFFNLADTPPLPVVGSAQYVLPGGSPLPPGLAALAGIQRDRTVLPGPSGSYDLVQSFRLDAGDIQATLAGWGVTAAAGSVGFGGCLQLTGTGFRDLGDQGQLISEWVVRAPWPRSARPGFPPAQPKFAVSVTDRFGYTWAQFDQLTSLPFQNWQSGDRVIEITPVPLPGDLPPGDYVIRLAVYDDEGGSLQATQDGRAVSEAPVVATAHLALRSAAPAPEPPRLLAGQEGNLLAPQGIWETPGPLIAGADGYVHVSWRPSSALDTAGVHFVVRAGSAAGALLWQQDDSLAQPLPGIWPGSQTIRLTHRLSPPPGTPVGEAKIEICAVRDGAVTLGCAAIGGVAVLAHTPLLKLPAEPRETSGANWGGYLTLVGYDAQPDGESIALILYWRVEGTVELALTRFVHVLGPDGGFVGQSDNVLRNGDAPVQLWESGEYLIDRVVVPVQTESTPSGLLLGLYDPRTGERVPAFTAGGVEAPDREIELSLSKNSH